MTHAWLDIPKPSGDLETTMAQQTKKSDKPNILVIWGDDIGISNLSCYSHGLMGYRTQNIDRIAADDIDVDSLAEFERSL
jgi:hypothetical protein